MRDEVVELRERVAMLEGQIESLLTHAYPEPDFDSGWEILDAHGGKEWSWDLTRRLAKADVLLKTGPESFEKVPLTPREGDVWAKPQEYSRFGVAGEVTSYLVYSKCEFPVEVRIQGWYEQAR